MREKCNNNNNKKHRQKKVDNSYSERVRAI